jgi:adenine-specific DNA-methyltransferase
MLMTTDPGDLVLDPTCGSGTTAYVAEQWGRRWITADVSRVPLALARQRLLTATFDWYELKDDARGPAGGFVYKRRQNKKGEEIGGIVPHVTLKSIANNQPPAEEVLVDRPEIKSGITRVTGPFCVEATIPTPVDWEGASASPHPSPLPEGEGTGSSPHPSPLPEGEGTGSSPHPGSFAEGEGTRFTERMIEVLRKSPVLRLGQNKTVTLKNVRPPAKTLSLSAEAVVDASATGKATLSDLVEETVEKNKNLLPLSQKSVAFVFGPENGAVSQKLVFEAAREAYAKSYSHLYVIGFAIQPNARELIEKCAEVAGVPATYVQATPDLLMGDLLKNMRSSQIFSVCGLPEVEVKRQKDGKYEVKLLGLDVFDPVTMHADNRDGSDVPCWLLDTDYNDLCFHVSQAFFPRTGAWDNLKRALRGEYDDSVWAHLAGTTSAPFEAGEHRKIAVKVIDDRGNELLVVKELLEAGK